MYHIHKFWRLGVGIFGDRGHYALYRIHALNQHSTLLQENCTAGYIFVSSYRRAPSLMALPLSLFKQGLSNGETWILGEINPETHTGSSRVTGNYQALRKVC